MSSICKNTILIYVILKTKLDLTYFHDNYMQPNDHELDVSMVVLLLPISVVLEMKAIYLSDRQKPQSSLGVYKSLSLRVLFLQTTMSEERL